MVSCATACVSRWFSLTTFVIFVFLSTLSIPASAQNIQWTRQFGSNRDDQANAVATSPNGVFVAGKTVGVFAGQTSAGSDDAFVSRYDNLGNQIWVRQFGTELRDEARGVAADSSGVYVVGWTEGTLPLQNKFSRFDAFVRKYDNNGTEQWTRQFGASVTVEAFAVAVNASGVYVVGVVECCGAALPSFPTTGGTDAFVRKYDSNGNELWTRQFGTINIERAYGVALDATGVYVAGMTHGDLAAPQSGPDGFLRRYDVNGNVVWTRQWGTPLVIPGGNEETYAVAVGPAGVFVSGSTTGVFAGQTSSGGWDAYVIKFDLNGTQQWVRQFGTTGGDYAYAVAVGTSSVLVGGGTGGAFPGQIYTSNGDAFVRLYDFDGNHLGTREFGNSFADTGFGAAADISGFYVAGIKSGDVLDQVPLGGGDAFAMKVLPPPVVSEGGVVNTASFAPSPAPLAPGSIASVFGNYLNDGSTVLFTSFGPNGRLVTSLGGTSATVNNIPTPMFFSTPGQLAIQIPYELAGQSTASIVVTVAGLSSAPRTINLAAVAPGVFTFSQSGSGAAVVIHQDGVTPVTAESPARPGEVVLLYATGLGGVTPDLATGAPSAGNQTAAATTVTVDGANAVIDFSGASPGFVGLYQVNFRIPANTRSASNLPLVLTVGGRQANSVTVAVGQ